MAPRILFEPSPRRVRVRFAGEVIADSVRMRLLHEKGHVPVYYFPLADVRTDLLTPGDRVTRCPWKGAARHWSIAVNGRTAQNVLWRYAEPLPEQEQLRDYCAFYWHRVDQWFEEDEEVFVHARDPYARVDAVASSREVRVVLGGAEAARSTRATFVFETRLPVRCYLPPEDVRMDLLTPSATRTMCPYKGTAHHWSADAGGTRHEDVAWSYPEPIAECGKIKGLICFYQERVDAVFVDGEAVARARPGQKP